MYPSLMFRINGVHPEEAGEAWKTRAAPDGGGRGGRHPPLSRARSRSCGPQRNPLEWRSNLTQLSNEDGSAVDGTDVHQMTRGELQGRQQVKDTFAFIKQVTPGFQDSYVVDIAPSIGIRETRRIVGAYQLTQDDVLECRDFDDTIGVNGWPVEAHVVGDVEFGFAPADSRGFNQLPYRMIVPQVVENLLVAGRCASMTQGGQSSGRVTGPCFVMGQAAGTAADIALSGDGTAAGVDVPTLQRRLEADGAYLGTKLPEGIAVPVEARASARRNPGTAAGSRCGRRSRSVSRPRAAPESATSMSDASVSRTVVDDTASPPTARPSTRIGTAAATWPGWSSSIETS